MNAIRLALIIALTPALLVPAAASAKCARTWAGNFTEGQPISPGDWVVVEAGGEAAEQLKTIAERSPRLVSGDHVVPLTLQFTAVGAMNRAQVVLVPTRGLYSGKTYQLNIQDGHRSFERLKWTVGGQRDRRVTVLSAPKVTNSSRQRYGCGPAVSIDLSIESRGTTLGFMVRATASDGTSQRYMVRSRNGELSIGHGMCSGGFTFKSGERYKIEVLNALSRTGRTIAIPSHTIVVTAP